MGWMWMMSVGLAVEGTVGFCLVNERFNNTYGSSLNCTDLARAPGRYGAKAGCVCVADAASAPLQLPSAASQYSVSGSGGG